MALGFSCLALWGPFVLMALYTLAAVSCSHCKIAAWKVLLPGPGLLPIELARQWTNWSRPNDGVWFVLGTIVALFCATGIARLARLARTWLIAATVVTFIACSAAAVGLLGAIRS